VTDAATDIRSLADDDYPNVKFGINWDHDLEITHEQKRAVFRKWKQDDNNKTWPQFAEGVSPTYGMDGAVTIQWCGMWLAIEKDGYTHS
jgi:hypothetical protein